MKEETEELIEALFELAMFVTGFIGLVVLVVALVLLAVGVI